jgi:dienelactone hydrolase
MPPLVISGARSFEGFEVAYDIFLPPTFVAGSSSPRPLPLALLLHGFAGKKEHMLGHATRLAALGLVVMTPNMSSLMKPSTGEAQGRNIRAVVDHVRWMCSLPSTWRGGEAGSGVVGDGSGRLVDPSLVFLFGHSAGGAVVFEAAAEMGKGSTPRPPACVVLLDGVPWPRTIAGAFECPCGVCTSVASPLFPPHSMPSPPPAAAPSFPLSSTVLLSLRSEPSAWNMKAEILKALAALPNGSAAGTIAGGPFAPLPPSATTSPLLLDLLIRRSGHGDPVDPKGSECFLKMMGLLGPPACWAVYEGLIAAVAEDAIGAFSGGGRSDDGAGAGKDGGAPTTSAAAQPLRLPAVAALVAKLEASGAVAVPR